jgi:hypothetical protein
MFEYLNMDVRSLVNSCSKPFHKLNCCCDEVRLQTHLWQLADEVVSVRFFGGLLDIFLRCIISTITNVLSNGCGKQDWFLAHNTDVLTQPFQVVIFDIDSINKHLHHVTNVKLNQAIEFEFNKHLHHVTNVKLNQAIEFEVHKHLHHVTNVKLNQAIEFEFHKHLHHVTNVKLNQAIEFEFKLALLLKDSCKIWLLKFSFLQHKQIRCLIVIVGFVAILYAMPSQY